jgi:hypothetical protein
VNADPDRIRSEAYTLKIYTVNGQLQMTIQSTTPETIIDVSHLSDGVYFLRIETGEFTGSEKFSIHR